MQVRENFPDYRPAVKVDFGYGMPTDWLSRYQILTPFAMAGQMDMDEYSEIMNLGVKLNAPPMPANQGTTAGMSQVV